ncbi:uncharacterized protein LOC114915900 isoform X2 [Cajanus cajan]|uniref:uncharacterized protein LOC114915900 isoform X2 n=1 Tax=Cajanus cajan TaxID=3821 RepID=UPI0010FB3E1A|nr:uncharacterized protein LOC114915900 isoform X2 [Cajanus cajan]
MHYICVCWKGLAAPPIQPIIHQRHGTVTTFASKSGRISLNSGTGKNKKNGNMFERWKCFDCQGFGLKSCPSCGKGGLTPEQRGER